MFTERNTCLYILFTGITIATTHTGARTALILMNMQIYENVMPFKYQNIELVTINNEMKI